MSDCPRTVFRGPTPAGFAKKSPTFECRAAPSTARSGGGSRTPEECDFSTCRSALTESSALRPPPEAMQTPIGVPSGTAKAGDSQSRDELSPKLGHSFGRDLPMTADATPRRKAATFAKLTSDLRWRRPFPNCLHSTTISAPRSLTARLGKSFPINSSFIGLISS